MHLSKKDKNFLEIARKNMEKIDVDLEGTSVSYDFSYNGDYFLKKPLWSDEDIKKAEKAIKGIHRINKYEMKLDNLGYNVYRLAKRIRRLVICSYIVFNTLFVLWVIYEK